VPETQFVQRMGALPPERAQLLPALLLAQAHLGYVSDWAIERIASHLRLTVNDVEGVATSYPELRRRPLGAHVVRTCTGLPCWTAGSERVLAALEAALGVRAGETTPDGRVTLEEVACCFVCAVAPAVEVDGRCRGRLTPEATMALVAQLRDASPLGTDRR
jgi:NADH:ubiquinone oxidoreductase subunit E